MSRRQRTRIFQALGLGALVVSLAAPAAAATEAQTKRASVSSSGAQVAAQSAQPMISGNGRFIAFWSEADDLVPGDSNGVEDAFVHDRRTGHTSRVNVRSNGRQANGGSDEISISASGRYVAFESEADNLVKNDTNGIQDVFVHDRATGKTRRVSIRGNGAQANGRSRDPAISADGRYVAFESAAGNLVKGDTNGRQDIFVHDRATGKTRRVSVRSNGAQGNDGSQDPTISADGRYVAFESDASDLVKGDTNGAQDIFVHDRATGKTRRMSVRSSGAQVKSRSRNAAISANGRYVAFESAAPQLVKGDANAANDIFVHDRASGKTRRVSLRSNGAEGNAGSRDPSISADGRYVAFESDASDLVKGDTNVAQDVFIHDRATGKTRRVSVRSNGVQGDAGSAHASVSADGRLVAFQSVAGNLVWDDTNAVRDVFVRGPLR
ncbi:PD40 domain-containing protein [soil metagenome]